MFLTASVPTFNGPGSYVRRLVAAGYKVGIISQTETAASKSDSGPFSRDLTDVFTRTTLLGQEISLSNSECLGDNVKSVMVALYEDSKEGIAICSVGEY